MKLPTILALSLLAQSSDTAWVERLAFWSGGELRQQRARLQQIETELATLPAPAMINSGNRTGFQTGRADDDEEDLWAEIELDSPALADTVALVPALVKGAETRVPGYGFPVRFRIDATDDHNHTSVLLETDHDLPNPGAYPFVVRFPPRMIKSVRLTATQPWEFDGPRVLALAELMLLSGPRNLALDAKVRSSSTRDNPPSWSRSNLTDMITPLGLPVAPGGSGPLGYHSAVSTSADAEKSIVLTLPQTTPLDELVLVPMQRSEVPSWFAYGFPVRYRIETSTELDFRDAVVVREHQNRALPSPGQNLVCFNLRHQPVRCIRITATRLWERRGDFVFALSEVQAWSGDRNIAKDARITASDVLTGDEAARFSPEALTNGHTAAGTMLTLPDWLNKLERRRDLEAEHTTLKTAHTALLARSEQQLVTSSVSGVIALSLLATFSYIRQRRARRRDAEQLRERLARDLHDEIGSNLGSIALLSAFATQDDATPDTMRTDLAEIERIARESADSMRDMVQLLSPRRTDGGKDWLTVLRNLAERQLRGIETKVEVPVRPLTIEPDIETRRELYLFCKEALHNAAKHSKATLITFTIEGDDERIQIIISDNGTGFDQTQTATGHGLRNLRERATSLHAELKITTAPGQGTKFQLIVASDSRWSRTTTHA
ncbi:MAG: hypothetical protein K1X78_03220 [Verrucomicrobiaceae bacterium]|nr:hypothetical protein [Verrucomicrobiaceae bacterium]